MSIIQRERGIYTGLMGPEGAGKSTQIKRLAEAVGYVLGKDKVMVTKEPGGTILGAEIRAILLSASNRPPMSARTEALLFAADRSQLTEELEPVLARGVDVLTDRFKYDSIAHQSYGGGVDLERLMLLNEFATDGLTPDIVVLLDLDTNQGLQRKWKAFSGGREEFNRIDARELDYHQRVADGYRQLARREPDRIITVDASEPTDKVTATLLAKYLPRRFGLDDLPVRVPGLIDHLLELTRGHSIDLTGESEMLSEPMLLAGE